MGAGQLLVSGVESCANLSRAMDDPLPLRYLGFFFDIFWPVRSSIVWVGSCRPRLSIAVVVVPRSWHGVAGSHEKLDKIPNSVCCWTEEDSYKDVPRLSSPSPKGELIHLEWSYSLPPAVHSFPFADDSDDSVPVMVWPPRIGPGLWPEAEG